MTRESFINRIQMFSCEDTVTARLSVIVLSGCRIIRGTEYVRLLRHFNSRTLNMLLHVNDIVTSTPCFIAVLSNSCGISGYSGIS